MRKLVLIVGVLALAGCNSEADTTDEDVVEEEVVEAPSVAGTYNGTSDDGEAWTGIIHEDGTMEIVVNDEVVETGTWRTNEEGMTCFMDTPEEGEVPDAEPDEDCYTFGEVGEDGTVVVTGADGESDTVIKVS